MAIGHPQSTERQGLIQIIAAVDGQNKYEEALRAAWQPFAAGWKALWWDCVVIQADAVGKSAFCEGERPEFGK